MAAVKEKTVEEKKEDFMREREDEQIKRGERPARPRRPHLPPGAG